MQTSLVTRLTAVLAVFSLSQATQFAHAGDDLVFVAVDPPCRIINTRNTETANIPEDGNRDFIGFGEAGELDAQGGDAGGCPNPRPGSTPVAISANITAVGNKATGNGNLVAFAAGGSAPGASLVNYKQGTNIANSSIIALCQGGGCTADFTLRSNNAAVPAIVDLQGFLYPKTLKNVITVSAENGDFTSPFDALDSIPGFAPSATNPYLIKLGPGFYDIGNDRLNMRSHISIIGAGVNATTIRSKGSGGAIFALNVVDAELAEMTILADAEGTETAITGVFINSTSGNSTNLHLHDLKIIAERGTSDTMALVVGNPASSGDISSLIERVDAIALTAPGGGLTAITINYCDETRIERVNAFGTTAGLDLGANANCTSPILFSQFDGVTDDISADNGASAVIGHSHLVNGATTLNGAAITCVAVTDDTGLREDDCAAASP